MSTLLKRLSLNLERRVGGGAAQEDRAQAHAAAPGSLATVHSFNDFSMHIQHEVDDSVDHRSTISQPVAMPERPLRVATRPSPFTVGSAPAGMAPLPTKALKIPRTSVAHILMREPSSTPRSSLDLPSSSGPTPRHSLSDEPGSPTSPRSPTSPSGRRRRQQKIHGMDYYEFCEIVRAGSL